ncbi:MAG: 4'-phosphopantetheinyl transferase superfamily protein [Bdellovibrionaceae bacterium]|nr:4'-phosphopantetheinyl transferase superfamily protein [Pseudobdellovibrionaceae bacterium]
MRKTVRQLQFPELSGSLKKAKIYLIEQFGSELPDHRLQLRTLVSEQLLKDGHSLPSSVQNLDKPISHPHLHLSLSHTMDACAFAYIDTTHRVGIDIEQLVRLTTPVIERVSTLKEREHAPDIRYLWPAKEATFKAISPRCQVISDIETHSWTTLNSTTWSYSVRLAGSDQTIDGRGLVCLISGHLLSFFVCEH